MSNSKTQANGFYKRSELMATITPLNQKSRV